MLARDYDPVAYYVEGLNLAIDQHGRYNCPGCGGVNSFLVSRDVKGIWYTCFRQGCDVSPNVITPTVTVSDIEQYLETLNVKHEQVSKKFQLPEYVVQTLPDFEPLNAYIKRYPWVTNYEDVRWDVRNHNLVWIVKDAKGSLVDAMGRAVAPRKGQPKVKRYGKSRTPFIVEGSTDFIVVFEDIPSALRVSQLGYSAGALMGTELPAGYVSHLKRFKSAYIVLDADAVSKAFKVQRSLEQYMETSVLILHGPDVKDMNIEEFTAFRDKLPAVTGDVRETQGEDSS